jgi:hypothetical protein
MKSVSEDLFEEAGVKILEHGNFYRCVYYRKAVIVVTINVIW